MCDYKELLKKYPSDSKLECEDIKEGIRNPLNQDEKKILIYRAILWKINRTINVSNELIERLFSLTNLSFEENEEQVIEVLKYLVNQKGIRLPMASTLMHFLNPNQFPVIDTRAYRAIMLWKNKKEYKFDIQNFSKQENVGKVYKEYVQLCREFYEEEISNREYNIDFFDIDKVLYMMDKKNKTLNGKEKE